VIEVPDNQEIVEVFKLGNSVALTIPVSIAKEIGIEPGTYLRISLKENKITLEKVKFEVDRK